MTWSFTLLVAASFALSLAITAVVRRVSLKLNAIDTVAMPGQIKMEPRKVPNTGGIGLFWGMSIPLLFGLFAANFAHDLLESTTWFPKDILAHIPGIVDRTHEALIMLGGCAALHALGLVDDRRPLGAMPKLFIMLGTVSMVVFLTDSRLLTLLDEHVGGSWLSILLTVIWVVGVANAMNFMDNMDGLAGGVGAVCAACFLATALMHGQWFVAAAYATLLGSLLGFLVHNVPPARIFMGDGGSLVLGFLLAFLSVRLTYVSPASDGAIVQQSGLQGSGLHGILTPLVILSVPLYDFITVTLLRLSKGKSPFVGDLNHVSHRMVRRGLTKPAAVAVICGFAAATASGGVLLSQLDARPALFVGVQTAAILMVVAVFEYAASTGPSNQGGRL